jgi:hypothetical protein
MTLIINMPFNSLTPPCFNSLLKLIYYSQGYKDFNLVVNQIGGSHIGWTRERLMGFKSPAEVASPDRSLFAGTWPDYDYILWLDSDIMFEVDDLLHLIDDNQDIVCGYYRMADARGRFCILEVSDKPDEEQQFMSEEDIKSRKELIEVQHCGFGFILIKKGVFEKITPPYFMQSSFERNGKTVYVGEDVSWCMKARAAGFRIFVDPRCHLKHFKSGLI